MNYNPSIEEMKESGYKYIVAELDQMHGKCIGASSFYTKEEAEARYSHLWHAEMSLGWLTICKK